MFLPETYQAALLLMILTMLCWGSWANTLKLCPGYRFQLFYWDYAFGLAAGAVALGLTGGVLGHSGPTFFADMAHAAHGPILYAVAGGVAQGADHPAGGLGLLQPQGRRGMPEGRRAVLHNGQDVRFVAQGHRENA